MFERTNKVFVLTLLIYQFFPFSSIDPKDCRCQSTDSDPAPWLVSIGLNATLSKLQVGQIAEIVQGKII